MVGEEQERPLLTVLLALEEQRRLRREQRDGGAETELLGRRPVAERAVADLVVVLRADDEPLGRLAVELGGETLERAVFRVVAVVLAREQDVQLVVQLVRPLGVVTPLLDRAEVARRHLGDDQRRPDALCELGKDVPR